MRSTTGSGDATAVSDAPDHRIRGPGRKDNPCHKRSRFAING